MMVSVVMSVFNEEKYIASAIESILNQSYSDFELIIINDGSTDNTVTIVQSFSDTRIRFFNHQDCKNQAVRANQGIALAQGKYIARMDGDDIALPKRLEKQVHFLENHPEIAIVGTQYEVISENKSKLFYKVLPTKSKILEAYALLFCPFLHSTVMFRKDSVEDMSYNAQFHVAQDYEFFTQILAEYEGANLKETLVQYRIHPNNNHEQKRRDVLTLLPSIFKNYAQKLGIDLEDNDLEKFLLISESNFQILSKEDLLELSKWLSDFFNRMAVLTAFDVSQIQQLKVYIWKELSWKIDKKSIPYFCTVLNKSIGYNKKSMLLNARLLKRWMQLNG